MSGKAKGKAKVTELRISKESYDRILMWSQSKKEINYLCVGTSNSIDKVVRLTNISRKPFNSMCEHLKQCDFLLKSLKIASKNILASGHSHPSKCHPKHPSVLDVLWLDKNSIELIAFPTDHLIKGWVIQRNLTETLRNEIRLIIVQ